MKITLEVFSTGITCWYKNDVYHRDGEHPAIIHSDGAKEFIKGQLIKIIKPDGRVIYIDKMLDR